MAPSDPAPPPLRAVERCPGCGGEARTPVHPGHGGIALVRCQECGLVHATAGYAPSFLDEHYTDRARRAPPAEADPATAAPTTTPRAASRRKRSSLALYDRLSGGRLRPAPPGARALDIGCGPGLLLDLLRDAGYTTVGIERSGAGALARAAGHRIHALDIEGEITLPERFFVVTLTHVLEHLRRAESALRWIRAHLQPEGLAIVEVPNWDDVARPLWGLRYRPLELGDHVSFFQRATLADLAVRAGFRVQALWSAAQARTLVFPSLLTGLDLGLDALRRVAPRPSDPEAAAVGVAGTRTVAGGTRWHHALLTGVLEGLDRLDPLLERLAGQDWAHGANLVAVLTPEPAAPAATR